MTALDALNRARRAWELSQPQLFFEVDGLDGEQSRALLSVEPAVPLRSLPDGGLTAGAEPCWDLVRTDGQSFAFPAPSPLALSPERQGDGSAPLSNQTGPDATPAEGARPAQEVTL